MNCHSQCTDRFAAAAIRLPSASAPAQRPLSSRAVALVRLIGDGHDLDDISAEIAIAARALARKASEELAFLVESERGYGIGDTVRESDDGPLLQVEGFRLAHGGRVVVVVLRRLLTTGASSQQTHTRVLDCRFEVIRQTGVAST